MKAFFQAAFLVASLAAVGLTQAHAAPLITEITLNGANATGSVSFEGTPFQAYFVPQQGGRVTISPYITGDMDDRSISVFVGLNYHPDGQQHDWQANAIGTFDKYQFWYPATIDYVFPKQTYYISVVDEIILPADFTFSAVFEPMPAPTIQALSVNAMPVPGRVDEGQFTYYTVTPSQSGNITVKLQMTDGYATVVGNLGSYATLGNNQWSAECDSSSATTCSFEALYIRAGQTVYVSVWGRMGKNVGDDDQDKAVDRYYLSVSN